MKILANSEIEELKEKLESVENYNTQLLEMYDNVRCFKHDFDNIITCISGYIKANDMDGLKRYFSQFDKQLSYLKTVQCLSPKVINNPAIYNLLISKYEKASSFNIEFNVESFLDFNNINMPSYELSKIIGIFLDNAIEASKVCENKKINISFRESKNPQSQIIIIENTYLDYKLDKDKIFEKGITSKEDHSGIGLWEVKKIISKNNNVRLITSIDKPLFKQELQIF